MPILCKVTVNKNIVVDCQRHKKFCAMKYFFYIFLGGFNIAVFVILEFLFGSLTSFMFNNMYNVLRYMFLLQNCKSCLRLQLALSNT